jgi:hypothetical protein
LSTLWTIAEFCDELVTAVSALPTITALTPLPEVRTSLPSLEEGIADYIVFGVDASDQEKGTVALGFHGHDEEVLLGCVVGVIRSGGGETEAKAARDRALLIVSIIDEFLREVGVNVGTQTKRQVLANRDYEAFPTSIGDSDTTVRVARVRFDIDYLARTDP